MKASRTWTCNQWHIALFTFRFLFVLFFVSAFFLISKGLFAVYGISHSLFLRTAPLNSSCIQIIIDHSNGHSPFFRGFSHCQIFHDLFLLLLSIPLMLLLTVYHSKLFFTRKKADILNQLLNIVLLHGIIFTDNIFIYFSSFYAFLDNILSIIRLEVIP